MTSMPAVQRRIRGGGATIQLPPAYLSRSSTANTFVLHQHTKPQQSRCGNRTSSLSYSASSALRRASAQRSRTSARSRVRRRRCLEILPSNVPIDSHIQGLTVYDAHPREPERGGTRGVCLSRSRVALILRS